jgi:hypothetical protein
MAEINLSSYIGLVDLAQREHNERLLPLINVLGQRLDIISDASWQECNDGTSFKGQRASTEPTGSYRAYDEGIAAEAGTSTPYEEPTCMLDGIQKTDVKKIQHRSNPLAVLAQYMGQYLAGMTKTFVGDIFNGNRSIDGKQINGLEQRTNYNTLSSSYVYDNSGGNASATANKTSMWLIGWGNDTKVSLIYPQNDAPGAVNLENPSVQGLGVAVEDLGRILTQDSDSNDFLAYVTYLEAHFGLCVHDPRYIRRVCNISTTNIDGVDDFSFDENYMLDAMGDIPDLENAFWYVPRILRTQIRKRVNEKGNVFHTVKDPFGKWVAMIDETPIRMVEQISITGAEIS